MGLLKNRFGPFLVLKLPFTSREAVGSLQLSLFEQTGLTELVFLLHYSTVSFQQHLTLSEPRQTPSKAFLEANRISWMDLQTPAPHWTEYWILRDLSARQTWHRKHWALSFSQLKSGKIAKESKWWERQKYKRKHNTFGPLLMELLQKSNSLLSLRQGAKREPTKTVRRISSGFFRKRKPST